MSKDYLYNCPDCGGHVFKTGKINFVKVCKSCNSSFELVEVLSLLKNVGGEG